MSITKPNKPESEHSNRQMSEHKSPREWWVEYERLKGEIERLKDEIEGLNHEIDMAREARHGVPIIRKHFITLTLADYDKLLAERERSKRLVDEIRKALPRQPKMDGIESYSHEQKIIYRALADYQSEGPNPHPMEKSE